MIILKNKWFQRFARKEKISDASLISIIRQIESGNADADLGSGLYKQRLARAGEGKSGAFRIIVCLKIGDCAFFVYGYSKSDKQNLTSSEKLEFKKIASILFSISKEKLVEMVKNGEFFEVTTQNEE